MLCNYLQNVAAITYIFVLQLSTFLFYNKQADSLTRVEFYSLMEQVFALPAVQKLVDTAVQNHNAGGVRQFGAEYIVGGNPVW